MNQKLESTKFEKSFEKHFIKVPIHFLFIIYSKQKHYLKYVK